MSKNLNAGQHTSHNSKAPKSSSGVQLQRDVKTGIVGYGALKGQFQVRQNIDVTKPIYEQANKKK